MGLILLVSLLESTGNTPFKEKKKENIRIHCFFQDMRWQIKKILHKNESFTKISTHNFHINLTFPPKASLQGSSCNLDIAFLTGSIFTRSWFGGLGIKPPRWNPEKRNTSQMKTEVFLRKGSAKIQEDELRWRNVLTT